MLTTATLGMVLYILYSIVAGVVDLVVTTRLEWWANVGLIGAATRLASPRVVTLTSLRTTESQVAAGQNQATGSVGQPGRAAPQLHSSTGATMATTWREGYPQPLVAPQFTHL